MMLKIWPWCKIRELDERNTSLILENLKNSARIAALTLQVDGMISACNKISEECSRMQRERDGLLNILALSPHERKRKRVLIRRWLRTLYEPVILRTGNTQWREIIKDDDDEPSQH